MSNAALITRQVEKISPLMRSFDQTHRQKQFEALRVNMERQLAHGGKITYVLPAFPFKSPNPDRVIDCKRADMAEAESLRNLAILVEENVEVHIMTDSRVFFDLFQVSHNGNTFGLEEAAVARFERGVYEIILEMDAQIPGMAEKLRRVPIEALMERVNITVGAAEFLRKEEDVRIPTIRMNCRTRSQYDGLKRTIGGYFQPILDIMDLAQGEQTLHRLTLSSIARTSAHSELITNAYPDALRLSIHVQFDTSRIGISLVPGCKQCPWNGVLVVKKDGSKSIVPKSKAEISGFALQGAVLSENRSDMHYAEI